MSFRNIGVVYRKEMLDSLRDRRTVISMIVVPVVVMPLLILGMGITTAKVISRARQEVAKVMVLGGDHSPKLMSSLKTLPGIEIIPPDPAYTNLIADKKIRAAIKVPADFEADISNNVSPTVEVFVYEGEMKSGFASETVMDYLRDLRSEMVAQRIAQQNLPANILAPFEIKRQNVAPPRKVAGNLLGGLLPYMVILLCLMGAMYPAMDLTAGEKERGTMETILCSPLSRTHLVLGKFLTVLTTSVATGLLALLSMSGTFLFARQLLNKVVGDKARDLSLSFDATSVVMVFVMILPVTIFFAAALLAISLFAKSFKEAQTYVSPLMFIVIIPAMVSMAPGIELDFRLALVPILNTSLVSKEIMTGNYHWGYIALIFLSSCAYASLALAVAVRLFQREDVLFRS